MRVLGILGLRAEGLAFKAVVSRTAVFWGVVCFDED